MVIHTERLRYSISHIAWCNLFRQSVETHNVTGTKGVVSTRGYGGGGDAVGIKDYS